MGVTISHTTFSPLSMVSTVIGFVSFTFTLATLLKVFWSTLGTFGAAPHEIRDFLSTLKQGLLEERRHIRRVRRRLKSARRERSHGPGTLGGSDGARGDARYSGFDNRRSRSGKRSIKAPMHFDRNIQSMQSAGEDEALQVLRTTVRDLIKSFRHIEQPFLKPEHQTQDSVQWSTFTYPSEKAQYATQHGQHSDDDSPSAQHIQRSNRFGHEYKKCGFQERWLWVRRKATVINLNEILSRVEVRRTAHEVGEVLSVVCDIGRDLEDIRASLDVLEGRLNRVVGVRRVD